MKTKNMRKKALLSSVAMLLVAVIALGGATFAWFSTNSAATATGINMKAKEDTNLLFAPTGTEDLDDATAWQANVALSTTEIEVVPCSSVNGYSLFKVTVGNTASTAAQTQVVSVDVASSPNYFEGSFLAKCSKVAYLKLDSITFPVPEGSTANNNQWGDLLRVSVQVTGAGSGAASETKIFYAGSTPDNIAIKKAVASPGTGVTLANLYDTETTNIGSTTDAKAMPKYIAPATIGSSASTDEADTAVFGQVAFDNASALTVTVRAWLEGNDPACVNTLMRKVVKDMVLTFSVSTTANGYVAPAGG